MFFIVQWLKHRVLPLLYLYKNPIILLVFIKYSYPLFHVPTNQNGAGVLYGTVGPMTLVQRVAFTLMFIGVGISISWIYLIWEREAHKDD